MKADDHNSWRGRGGRAACGPGATHLCLPPAACLHLWPHSALDPAGPQAGRISHVWWVMFVVSVIVFALVIMFLFFAIYRARRREAPAAEPEARRKMTRAVVAATVLTTVILFGLLVDDVIVGRALSSLPAHNDLAIEVVGHQWWWEVRYPHEDPSQSFTTANEIHIPVGRSVMLTLTSRDVIHSFWVPNLHGKKDLIPGHMNTMWVQADSPGVYRGQCAEFCGYQHAHMALVVVAEPEEQFDAWYDRQRSPAVQPTDPQQARGQQVFLSSRCVMCHRVVGTPAGSIVGPDLTHVGGRQEIAAGALPNTRDHLARWVVDSQEVKPGNRMPPNNFSPEDLDAMLAYLEGLK
ncbi:MAG: cytochrome c oxidase subunit II [Blastocatellia bacterium]